MTANEFNRRVSEDIAWMVRRNQLRYDADQFMERYLSQRSLPEFKDAPDYDADEPDQYADEKYLDDRERAGDINRWR